MSDMSTTVMYQLCLGLYCTSQTGPIYRLHTGKVHYQAMIVTEVSSMI